MQKIKWICKALLCKNAIMRVYNCVPVYVINHKEMHELLYRETNVPKLLSYLFGNIDNN